MISAYNEIITLENAKIYLRIDDNNNEDDFFIESCIVAAFQWIEKYTNHILITDTEKEYFPDNGYSCSPRKFSIYDFPIIDVMLPVDESLYTVKRFNLKTQYSSSEESITLRLGYTSVDEIPSAIIQAAYAIIQDWYYNSEKTSQSTLVPDSVKFALNPYRRFIC